MTHPASPNDPRRDRSGRSLPWVLGGAVLASLCCAAPLAAVLIGIGGATSIIGLVRFKWEFLAAGLVVTLVGIGVTLRRRRTSCSVKSYRRNRLLLPVAGVLAVLLLTLGAQHLLLNEHII